MESRLASILGLGSGVAALLFVAAILVARHALVQAVQQAGARELELMRRVGAENLERFRAELALQSELRRQLAAARLAAFTKIAHASRVAMRCSIANAHGDPTDRIHAAIEAQDELNRTMIDTEHLLSKACAQHIYEQVAALARAQGDWFGDFSSKSIDPHKRGDGAYQRAHDAHYRIIAVIREELDPQTSQEAPGDA